MSLSDLRLSFCYDSGASNLVEDFYVPCMKRSNSYDRAVGYFSSSIYEICWAGLRGFLQNNGKIRIVCSHVIQPRDFKVLEAASSHNYEAMIQDEILSQIDEMMGNNRSQAALEVFAYLLSTGILSFKIAIPNHVIDTTSFAVFHQKLGVFKDSYKNCIAFKGSSNESKNAFDISGNTETIDVYSNWLNRDEEKRVQRCIDDFENLWSNKYPGVTVFTFPEAVRRKLLSIANEERFSKALELMESDDLKATIPKLISFIERPDFLVDCELRKHQSKSLDDWEKNSRKGLLEHATGSGKTITGISAAIKSLNDGKSAVILVPSNLLLKQWSDEIKRLVKPNVTVLKCGAGNNEWKDDNLLSQWLGDKSSPRIVLATMATASTDRFLNELKKSSDILIVADEVHRLGSPVYGEILDIDVTWKLGLSATPHRVGDPIGTSRITDYFGDILPTKFLLKDAITSGVLTRYHYSVSPVELTESEMSRWVAISHRIATLLSKKDDPAEAGSKAQLERLMIERFRVIKGAENKIPKALQIIREQYKSDHRWIVYCDNVEQLNHLYSELYPLGLPLSKYYSGMVGDKEQTLKYFEKRGGVILSVKCLDEGVDIPAASHALIVASSQNPREFIQRRGRVLRRSPNKSISYIFDMITIPSMDFDESELKASKRFILSELARASLFAEDAMNPNCKFDISRIAERFDINLLETATDGEESEETGDE